MENPFDSLISSKEMGVFYFDGRLQVVECNAAAKEMLSLIGRTHPGGDLQDLFPELVGIEDQLARIIEKRDDNYRLELINRQNRNGATSYWDLILLACPEKERGILALEDVTEKAQAIQAVNQLRYEDFLYRHSIDQQRHKIGSWFMGRSAAVKEVVDTVRKLGRVPSATVLLMGETGTGKSLTARMIHESSMPDSTPFVEINCAALPETLIEAELFGYEKGSFTHAVTAKPGLIEEASGGTLFLDEIGELPINAQAKLLSMIETKSFRRLGSNKKQTVEVRIIAATNRSLQTEVAAKRFREDLFYRLNVVSMTLPPLRELGEDVVLIAEHFIHLLNMEFNKKVKGLSADAHKALLEHHWPGNVRELSNCIERAMIFIDRNRINASDLVLISPAEKADADDSTCWTVPAAGIDLEDVERRLIVSALDQAKNNKSKAARLLGLTRHTLRYRMEKHGLA